MHDIYSGIERTQLSLFYIPHHQISCANSFKKALLLGSLPKKSLSDSISSLEPPGRRTFSLYARPLHTAQRKGEHQRRKKEPMLKLSGNILFSDQALPLGIHRILLKHGREHVSREDLRVQVAIVTRRVTTRDVRCVE